MAQASFTNPATGDTYVWQRNPESGDQRGKARQISGSANTGLTGRVRQQGDAGPLTLKYTVHVVHHAMRVALWQWFHLCDTQTIIYTDYDGAQYEVQITNLQEQPVYRIAPLAPDADMRNVYYAFTIEMDVYRFISGALVEAGLTP